MINEFKETLSMDNGTSYKQLQIRLGYELGGPNYFTGRHNRRGYYLYLTPCSYDKATGMMSSTLLGDARESGYKILLQEVKRKNARIMKAWSAFVTLHKIHIRDLYQSDRHKELSELFKDVCTTD